MARQEGQYHPPSTTTTTSVGASSTAYGSAPPNNKKDKWAVYTHADGRSERVRVVKQHSAAEGDGVTIRIPSLDDRERQTTSERLTFLDDDADTAPPQPYHHHHHQQYQEPAAGCERSLSPSPYELE